MRKIAFVLAVLLFAAPALAATVTISIVDEGLEHGVALINYATDGNLPRGFALSITVDGDATIDAIPSYKTGESTSGDKGYGIFPGSIDINDTTGAVDDYGDPVAPADAPDLPGQLGSSSIVIEMGSLYVGGPNAPNPTGTLCKLEVSETCKMSAFANGTRGGVVMEDPDEAVTVVPAILVDIIRDPNYATCWDPAECAGQPSGDATCDGVVNLNDLAALKAAWGMSAPYTAPHCGADFTQDGTVNLNDLAALKAGWGTSGYVYTDNQTCP